MERIITEKDYPIERMWLIAMFFSGETTLSRGRGGSLAFVFLGLLSIIFFDYFPTADLWSFLQLMFYVFAIIMLVWFIRGVLVRSNFHYSIEDNFLTLKQGIISKQERRTPYGMIQNIFVRQNLFERIFGLASLVLESVGSGGAYIPPVHITDLTWEKLNQPIESRPSQSSLGLGFGSNEILIAGLKKQNAEILKEIILRKIKENPVKDTGSGL